MASLIAKFFLNMAPCYLHPIVFCSRVSISRNHNKVFIGRRRKKVLSEWLKSWRKLESDDASHSLLVGKIWIGKISHQKIFSTTSFEDKFDFAMKNYSNSRQFWCWLEALKILTTSDQKGSGYIEENIWLFSDKIMQNSSEPKKASPKGMFSA